MILLCFFILFVSAVFNIFAQNIIQSGRPVAVHCDNKRPPPQSTLEDDLPWSSTLLFPVLVCAKLNGDIKTDAESCPLSRLSRLDMHIQSGTNFFSFPAGLGPEHCAKSKRSLFGIPAVFVPTYFSNTRESRCRLFLASEIAEELKDQNLADFKLTVRAKLYATPEDGSSPTIEVTVRALAYEISAKVKDHPLTPSPDRTVHAIVCHLPNCKIIPKGKVQQGELEYFSVHEGKTPVYEGQDGPVTKKMFSVTSFVCEPGKCPQSFSAVDTSTIPPEP